MNRYLQVVLVPPMAVCRYGCASCCAVPVGVLWLAAIMAEVLGYLGGPMQTSEISWQTMGIGVLLWLISAIWAYTAVRTSAQGFCEKST